jgi:hypothetical protein
MDDIIAADLGEARSFLRRGITLRFKAGDLNMDGNDVGSGYAGAYKL